MEDRDSESPARRPQVLSEVFPSVLGWASFVLPASFDGAQDALSLSKGGQMERTSATRGLRLCSATADGQRVDAEHESMLADLPESGRGEQLPRLGAGQPESLPGHPGPVHLILV